MKANTSKRLTRQFVTLPDGRRVRVRPIRHEDAPLLLQAFERLSATSRYQRFLGPTDRLSTPMVDYLTSIDHELHEALVAVDESGEIVGVARFIRSLEDTRAAEVAVTVIDDWQSDGVGTVLMERLIPRARELGNRTLHRRHLLGEQEDARAAARLRAP